MPLNSSVGSSKAVSVVGAKNIEQWMLRPLLGARRQPPEEVRFT
jgi:hypothetical protein